MEERGRWKGELDLSAAIVAVVVRISIFHAPDFAGGGRTKTVQPSKYFAGVL